MEETANARVDIAKLKTMRETGATQADCCKEFGVHQRVIQRILDAEQLPRFVPSVIIARCPVCEKEYRKDKNARKVCSFLCAQRIRANPKADEAAISKMYLSMMTHQEIADEMEISLKSVQKALKRAGTPSRRAVKRDQLGANNTSWRGELVQYKGAHQRVRSQRGKPTICTHCKRTDEDTKLHWASLTKEYHNIYDYIPLCVRCHSRWDRERREK